eukprot:274386-Chlamydomonas_euryale.AAC.1
MREEEERQPDCGTRLGGGMCKACCGWAEGMAKAKGRNMGGTGGKGQSCFWLCFVKWQYALFMRWCASPCGVHVKLGDGWGGGCQKFHV